MTPNENEKNLDNDVTTLIEIAKWRGKKQQIPLAAAFAKVIKDIPRVSTAQWSRMFDAEEFVHSSEQLEARRRHARLGTLRLDLEAALLRLDACPPGASHAKASPTHPKLKSLEELIDATVQMLGKRTPATCWERCKKVDRHFPKLRLCKRVTAFVTRMVNCIPPRPLGVLMQPKPQNLAQTKSFFDALQKYRKRKDEPAKENWLEFESLLVRYQNAELERAGKTQQNTLWRKPGTPNGPEDMKAYVTFLELDRADLLWTNHHWQKLWPVLMWTRTLGNEALLRKLESFWPGTINFVQSSIENTEELKVARKRGQTAARKAKSRKNLAKKRDESRGLPSLT